MNAKCYVAGLCAAWMVSFVSFGQEQPQADKPKAPENEMKTLWKAPKFRLSAMKYIGVYFAPAFQYGQLNSGFSPMIGASAGVLFNKRLAVGVAGYGTVNQRFSNTESRLNYGGAKVEYTFLPNNVFHFSVPLLVGGGFANSGDDIFPQFGGRNRRNGSSFFVVQPGINLEVNLFRYVKLFGGASYRVAAGVENRGDNTYSAAQLSGFNTSVGVKAGIFDWQFHKKPPRVKKTKRSINQQ